MRKVKPREVLAAMRLAAGLSRIALDNQRVERLDKAAADNAFTLKDAVVPCMGLAHERLMEEVRRRGLEYAAELDMETSRDASAIRPSATGRIPRRANAIGRPRPRRSASRLPCR